MIEDFEFNAETGLFDDVASESVLPEVVLRLTAKAGGRISDGAIGQTPLQGDWFLFPAFGSRSYEARTISPDIDKQIIDYTQRALKPMIGLRKIKKTNIAVSSKTKNGISVDIEVMQSDETIIQYTHFVEVV